MQSVLEFIISFNEIIYKSGGIGLLIGPACKGSVDFIYLFTNEIAKEELWHSKWGNFFKIGGIVLLIAGIIEIINNM
jgi:hypothetical protein